MLRLVPRRNRNFRKAYDPCGSHPPLRGTTPAELLRDLRSLPTSTRVRPLLRTTAIKNHGLRRLPAEDSVAENARERIQDGGPYEMTGCGWSRACGS